MIIDERIFSKLTDEQKMKVEAARSPEELLAIAKEIGYELSDEQLAAVAKGSWCEDHCANYLPSFCKADSASTEPKKYGVCDKLCFVHG